MLYNPNIVQNPGILNGLLAPMPLMTKTSTITKIEFLPRKDVHTRMASAAETFRNYDQMSPGFICMGAFNQKERDRMIPIRTIAELSSPLLGALGRQVCQTCNMPGGACPGHCGIVILPEECRYFVPSFKQYLPLVLNSICINCGELRLTMDALTKHGVFKIKNPYERLRRISEVSCEIKNCTNSHPASPYVKRCGAQPKFPKMPSKFDSTISGGHGMTPRRVHQLLDSLSENTCHILGFANKEAILCFTATYVIVAPTIVRPNLITLDHREARHQLTTLYAGILSTVDLIKNGNSKKSQDDPAKLMYDAVCALLFGKSSEPLGQNDPVHIAAMLPKKEGVIRKTCTGKRLNNNGRDTAQTAQIPLGCLIVPRSNFSAIGFEYVILDTSASVKLAQKWAEEGLIMTFRQPRAEAARVQYTKAHFSSLKPGIIVERRLLPGDRAIVIRQPTLSIHSCLGFRIYPGAENILQINRIPATGYNLDFDGDELNFQVLTSSAQIPEAKYIMGVDRCQGSAKGNRTVPCCILDSIVAGFLLSQPDRYLDDIYIHIAHRRMRKVPELNVIRKRIELMGGNWNSGRTLISMCLPAKFCYSHKGVEIINGVFLAGSLTKDHLKDTPNSIAQYIRLRYGENVSKYYIDNICRTLEMWMSERYGLSLGIGDCSLTVDANAIDIPNLYIAAVNVYDFYSMQQSDEFLRRLYYYRLDEAARSFTQESENINIKNIPETNAFRLMSFDAGSKGDKKNIMQILNAVGQQFIFGQLPKRTLSSNSRVCYSSDIYDPNPLTSGLCVNSYITGLTPDELLQAATTGRNGITDTTTKTPQVGKISRRTNNALGAIRSGNMHEIRGNESRIVQFVYNGDGYDGTQTYLKSGKVLPFDIESLVTELNTEAGWKFDPNAEYVPNESNPIVINVPEYRPRMTMFEFVRLQTTIIKDIESGKLPVTGYDNDSNVCKIVKKMIARQQVSSYFIHRGKEKISAGDMDCPFGVDLSKYE